MARNLQENPKAVYRLATTGEALQIHIPKSIAPDRNTFDKDTVQIRRGFSSVPGQFVQPSAEHGWGYGGVLETHEGAHPDWITYKFDLPKPTHLGVDWDNITNGVATLRLLLTDFSTFLDADPQTDIPQLTRLHLNLGQKPGDNWAISMDGTPAFATFIAQNAGAELNEGIQSRMQRAYTTMAPFGLQPRDIQVDTEEALHLNIGLLGSPSIDAPFIKPGQEFFAVSHNVVNSVQQISLLTGIAELEGRATAASGF